jgi:Tol biopolymer transport system component
MKTVRIMLASVLFAVLGIARGVGAASAGAHANANRGYLVWTRITSAGDTGQLVISDPAGRHVRQLSHPPTGVFDIDARISPNGQWILFERDLPDRAAAGLIRFDGTGERLLNLHCADPCVGSNTPSWMPDGRHILYDRVSGPFDSTGDAASASLWKSDLYGGRQVPFSDPALDPTTEETDPTFMPDGHVIVVRGLRDLRTAVWRLNSDGTHPHQLTPYSINADLPQASPARSGPSAGLVVFETFGSGVPDDATEGPSIATVPANCGSIAACSAQIHYLTSRSAMPVQNFNPAWSPDGRQVIFVHAEFDLDQGIGDIYRMGPRGGPQTPISTDPRFEFRPAWGSVDR